MESLAEVSLLQHSGNKGWSLTTRTDESEIFVYNHEGLVCNYETRLETPLVLSNFAVIT